MGEGPSCDRCQTNHDDGTSPCGCDKPDDIFGGVPVESHPAWKDPDIVDVSVGPTRIWNAAHFGMSASGGADSARASADSARAKSSRDPDAAHSKLRPAHECDVPKIAENESSTEVPSCNMDAASFQSAPEPELMDDVKSKALPLTPASSAYNLIVTPNHPQREGGERKLRESEIQSGWVQKNTTSTYGAPQKITWRANMELHEVLDYTSWCLYCLCGGCGCNSVPTHCKLTLQCLCCAAVIESVVCGTVGCCSCVQKSVCCACFSEFPPQEATPCCVVSGDPCTDWCPRHRKYPCGKALDRNSASIENLRPPTPYEAAATSHDACFCCCCGCSQCFHPDCFLASACCCTRGHCNVSLGPEWMSCLLTCFWLYGQCWFIPKSHGNPMCACCGKRQRPPTWAALDSAIQPANIGQNDNIA